MKNGIGSHQSPKMKNDEWLTPISIINSLGSFDLDPCSPIVRPWDTAKKHFTLKDNGLEQKWFGRVWCNPPYGLIAKDWLNKLSKHGSGIALIFARTETKMFFDYVWNKANSVLFFEGRLFFHRVDGVRASANAGAPSCLVSYSDYDTTKIYEAMSKDLIKGKLIQL